MIPTIVATGLSLAGIWILGFWLYRVYRVDVFRQDMFELRDKLFDFAREGGISFDDPAYRGLRSMCNGYIRFGHRISISSAVIFSRTLHTDEREWLEAEANAFQRWWDDTVGNLDSHAHSTIESYKNQMETLVAKQLVFGSPVMVGTVIPAVLLWVVVWFQVELVKHFWNTIGGDRMDGAALALGQVS